MSPTTNALVALRSSQLLLNLYANPEKQPGLYSYAKALEAIESGLLGGFYYKHFCLASKVIGTGAKGTMMKSVLALKRMYEQALFPNLDMTRSEVREGEEQSNGAP